MSDQFRYEHDYPHIYELRGGPICTCCFNPCVTYDRNGDPRTYNRSWHGFPTWDGRMTNTASCLRESDPRKSDTCAFTCDYPSCLTFINPSRGQGRSCHAHPQVCVTFIQFPSRSLNFDKKTLLSQGNSWEGELRVEVSGPVEQLQVWSDPNGEAIYGGESHTEWVGRSGREQEVSFTHSDLTIGTGQEAITIKASDITILSSSKSLERRDGKEELMWEENPLWNQFKEKDEKLKQMLELAIEKQDAELIQMVVNLQAKDWNAQAGFPSGAFIGDYDTAVALLELLKEVENKENVVYRAQRLYFIAHRFWKLLHEVCQGNQCDHPVCRRPCTCTAKNPTKCGEAECRSMCSVNTGATSLLFVCPTGYDKTQHLENESRGNRYIQKVLELDESAVMVAYVSFFRNYLEENAKHEGTKIKMCELLEIANCTVYGHSETLAYGYTSDHNIIDILKTCREWWEGTFDDGSYSPEKVKNKKK